jgi:hypothetical protein
MVPTAWSVILKPARDEGQEGENLGGVVIHLHSDADDEYDIEFSRVAFIRRNSKNPKKKFGDALQEEIEKAQLVVDAINDFQDELDRARSEQILATRDRIRELLGRGEAMASRELL